MGENSKIEWTDHTWNLWRGCTEVSPACDHCYAREMAKRNPAVLGQWGPGAPRVLAAQAYRVLPLKWNQQAKKAGGRRRVFALSMGDWLDDEVPAGWLAELLAVVHATPHLDWLLLSKRPAAWLERCGHALAVLVADGLRPAAGWLREWLHGTPPHNVWIGTTVEDQTRADQRIPELLQIPARVRFLSCEPLLGAVNLPLGRIVTGFPRHIDARGGRAVGAPLSIHWVIAGGESGHHARPMHTVWLRDLRDQCVAAGVPFFFKQWGEWRSLHLDETPLYVDDLPAGGVQPWLAQGDPLMVWRMKKKAAGRVLDGREWSEFPATS